MSMNKLMRFRKDRLFESDSRRQNYLIDSLKNNRIIDDMQSCAMFNLYNSPNKNTQAKNFSSDVKNSAAKGS